MKKCPNCNKIYRDYDQYCAICNCKLKYIEESSKIEYCPEPMGSVFDNPKPKGSDATNTKPTVTCPYCHSTNTKKISNFSKTMNLLLVGSIALVNEKQWHCNNCNSKF